MAILLGFLIALPGVGSADNGEVDAELSFAICGVVRVGTVGVDRLFAGFGVGRPEVVTARVRGLMPAFVLIEADTEPLELGRDCDSSGVSGSGFLVFARGRAGKGPEGGGEIGGGGREDGLCGIAEVIVAVVDVDIAMFCS